MLRPRPFLAVDLGTHLGLPPSISVCAVGVVQAIKSAKDGGRETETTFTPLFRPHPVFGFLPQKGLPLPFLDLVLGRDGGKAAPGDPPVTIADADLSGRTIRHNRAAKIKCVEWQSEERVPEDPLLARLFG